MPTIQEQYFNELADYSKFAIIVNNATLGIENFDDEFCVDEFYENLDEFIYDNITVNFRAFALEKAKEYWKERKEDFKESRKEQRDFENSVL